MQWLIDIITSLFTDRHRYFNRGDPAGWDYQVGDFVQDNTWRDLDLSAIVPADAVLVLFRVAVEATNISDIFNLRKNGNINVHNAAAVRSRIANIRNTLDVKVTPDSDRVIEYKCFLNTFTRINVLVAGWWLR